MEEGSGRGLLRFTSGPVVDAEVVEKVFFCKAVHPVFFWNLLSGNMLAEPGGHALQFSDSGAADGGIRSSMFLREGLHQIRSLEDDAAAGVLGADFAEVLEKGGTGQDIINAAGVVDVFFGKLDDRAGLDVTTRADVVADARSHGAEGLAFVVVVGVYDGNGGFGALLDDKFPHLDQLIRTQGQFRRDFGPDGAVGVIPRVVDAPVDQAVQPFFREEIVNIGLAEAGGHASEEFLIEAVSKAAQSAAEDVFAAAAEVADMTGAFDADQGGAVPELAQFFGHFFGDHLAVGEDLEIAVRMLRQEVEEAGVEEGLAAEHSEEAVPMGAGIIDEAVQLVEFDHIARGVDVYPAPLTAEIAAIDDAEVEEWWKDDAPLETLFE